MAKQIAISKFMESLGFKLANINWSWGAYNADKDTLLLRQNIENFNYRSKEVKLLGSDWNKNSLGYSERLNQLRDFALNIGEISCYAMVITGTHGGGVDNNSYEITGYKDDRFFPITEVRFTDEGDVYGIFGSPVLASEM